MNKIALSIISLGFVIAIIIMFSSDTKINSADISLDKAVQDTKTKDGIQYITISARGGYSPRVSQAVAGIPTKLIVKTNATYDCSAALMIRSIGYRKILPQTGETIIDIGTFKTGEIFKGTCSMGMYSFQINFK